MRSPGWPLKERNVRKLWENSVGLLRILPFGCLLSLPLPLPLLLLLLILLREVEGEIEGWRTTEGVVLIDLGPNFGVWAASCPWILDVETSVCSGYEVDMNAGGQQEASGGRHCSRGGGQHGERSEERAVTIIE